MFKVNNFQSSFFKENLEWKRSFNISQEDNAIGLKYTSKSSFFL